MTRPKPPSARLRPLSLVVVCSFSLACATARLPALPKTPAPGPADAARADSPHDGERGRLEPREPEAGKEPTGTFEREAGREPREEGVAEAPEASPVDRLDLRERILAAARQLLGHRPHLDCSGYVLAAFRAAGLAVTLSPDRSRSAALLAASQAVASPQPGDLALFHDTYDRNRSGKLDAGITHVALVETVDGDDVTLLHRGRKVERFRMNLLSPSDRSLNDPVRMKRHHDPPQTRYLAGELFTTYAALPDGMVTEPSPVSLAEDTSERHLGKGWQSKRSRRSRPVPSPSTEEPAR
jgi:peptidoglycan DL-endopeptidase CwlO